MGKFQILFQISLKIIPNAPIDHKLVLVQAMAGLVSSRRQGIIWTNNYPVSSLTHICVTMPQCVTLVNAQAYICKT